MPYLLVLERASGTHKHSVQQALGLLTSTCSVVCLFPQVHSNKLRLAALEVPGFIFLWCLGAQRKGMVISMKDLTTQTGIIVKCSKTAIEFFQNAQSVDFFSALEIPKEFQDIAVEFYDLIMENDHLAALLGCRGNYDIAIQIDEVTGTMTGWHWFK